MTFIHTSIICLYVVSIFLFDFSTFLSVLFLFVDDGRTWVICGHSFCVVSCCFGVGIINRCGVACRLSGTVDFDITCPPWNSPLGFVLFLSPPRLGILGAIISSCQVSSRSSFSLLLLILVRSAFSLCSISCTVGTTTTTSSSSSSSSSSFSISFNICISSSLLLLFILGSSCSMVDSSSFNTVVFSIFSSSLLLCKLLSSTTWFELSMGSP